MSGRIEHENDNYNNNYAPSITMAAQLATRQIVENPLPPREYPTGPSHHSWAYAVARETQTPISGAPPRAFTYGRPSQLATRGIAIGVVGRTQQHNYIHRGIIIIHPSR